MFLGQGINCNSTRKREMEEVFLTWVILVVLFMVELCTQLAQGN